MTLDDIKGRTYTNQADFWRDIEQAFKNERKRIAERLTYVDVVDDSGELWALIKELEAP